MQLRRQTIIITGATSGIGKALAVELSKRNNHIIAVARSEDKLKHLQNQLPSVTTIRCDLSVKQDVVDLAESLERENLKISVLINNAATQNTPKFSDPDFSFKAIQPEITTNFTSIAWLVALLLPTLSRAEKGGAIINLSSGLALYPKTGSAIYCATKAAIHSLSQSLRYQLASGGVCIHEVLLPLVDTPMTKGRGRNKLSPARVAADIIAGVEKGREEIWVGKARFLPLLNRISPSMTRNMMKKF